MSTHETINDMIISSLGLTTQKITPETNLADDLGADSLDAIEIAMAIEEQWDLNITDEEIEKCATVQNIYDLVDKLLAGAK